MIPVRTKNMSTTPAATENTSQTPLQKAEAKMAAASQKHLEIRYRNYELCQKAYRGKKEEMEKLNKEIDLLQEKYDRKVAEDDKRRVDTGKSLDDLEARLNLLKSNVFSSVGKELWKEEWDAETELVLAFEDVWCAKGSPLV